MTNISYGTVETREGEIDSDKVLAGTALFQKLKPGHWSSCAIYNAPAYPVGPCDCGGYGSSSRE